MHCLTAKPGFNRITIDLTHDPEHGLLIVYKHREQSAWDGFV